MQVQIVRVGRPRSQNVNRDEKGKSRGETLESVFGVALAHRLKQGIAYETAVVRDERTGDVVAVNQHSGHLLGQLKLLGNRDGISEKQFFTGMEFAALVHRYASHNGIPLNVRAFDYGGAKGASLAEPPKEKTILETRQRYNDCCHLLADADRSGNTGNRIQKIVRLACLEQIELREFHFDEHNLGNLRMGLNVLQPMFGRVV